MTAGGPTGEPTARTLAQTGEDRLVSGLLARLAATGILHDTTVLDVGPGDDAAVLAGTPAGARTVLSTDTLAEGHDFRRDWSTPEEIGIKLVAQSLADVASMGARPQALLLSLAAPGDLETSWVLRLADGVAEECARAGAAVAGGDVSAASTIVLTGTAVGVLDGRPVLRSGARPGDVLALAGRTGPAAAGLALLNSGVRPGATGTWYADVLAAQRAPRPLYDAAVIAARAGAHALIDTSDGLLRDATRLAKGSRVRLDLDSEALLPGEDLLCAAEAVGRHDEDAAQLALTWVLSGGEDHAFLGSFDPRTPLPPGFRLVGRVLPAATGDTGMTPDIVTVDAEPWAGPTGWTHFT